MDTLKPGQIVTLTGPGGVGKTALVSEVIWRLAPGDDPPQDFPDGIIFHSFYNDPQADYALEHIARSFGEEPRPSPGAAALRALAGKKALLILDGTENTDDLKAVLNVQDQCGVFITSRQKNNIEGTHYSIAPLSTDEPQNGSSSEAVILFQEWGKARAANEIVAHQICKLIGGLPLAIRLAGRYLYSSNENAGEYLAWLEETPLAALHHGKHQHESIPILLDKSLERVSEAARNALGVAGVLALAPFSKTVIAASMDISEGKAGRLLGELVNYSLLDRGEQQYTVTHALVYTHAQDRLSVPAVAVKRLADYYIELVGNESEHGREGFTRLDKERFHIMATLVTCDKRKNWESAQGLAQVMQEYLSFRGSWTERMTITEIWLTAARELEDQDSEGEALTHQGLLYISSGQYRQAAQLCHQASTIHRQTGNKSNEAAAWQALGMLYCEQQEFMRGHFFFQRAYNIYHEIGDRKGQGVALSNMGTIYSNMDHPSVAIEFLLPALAIFRVIGDRGYESGVLLNLGINHANLEKFDQAIEYYQQALTIFREIGNRHGEGTALTHMGVSYEALGQFEQAVELHQQALAIFQAIGHLHGELKALSDLGSAYHRRGEKEQGDKYLKQAQTIAIFQLLAEMKFRKASN